MQASKQNSYAADIRVHKTDTKGQKTSECRYNPTRSEIGREVSDKKFTLWIVHIW